MTMTRTNDFKTVKSRAGRAALALGVLLAAAGCAGAEMRGPYPFTIKFETVADKQCPTEAVMAENKRNCGLLFKDKDCVKARRGETVTFTAAPANEFEVHFDPFRKSGYRAGKDGTTSLVIDAQAPYKTYAFYVVSGQCPVLDPIIIVEN